MIGGYTIGGATIGGDAGANVAATQTIAFPAYLLLETDGRTYLYSSGGDNVADFWMAKGDLAPLIRGQLVDGNLDPVSLAGAASVRFNAVDRDTGASIIDAAATIEDGATGRVSYTWQTADTAAKRELLARFVATLASGQIVRFPNVGHIHLHVGA